MRRIERCVALATVFSAVFASAPALAQLTGGPVVPANPGGISSDIGVGIMRTQLSPYSLGQTGTFGGPVGGASISDQHTPLALAPSNAVSWGVPGGLFGAPAEIWGRFSYKDSTANPSTPLNGFMHIPYIDGQARSVLPAGLTFIFLDGGTVGTLQRRQTSYEAEAGARSHFMFGSVRVSPSAFIGYQRLDQSDSFSASSNPFDVQQLDVKNNIQSDYYRFGLGLGTSMPTTFIGPSVSWFNYLSGSADIVRSNFNATQTVAFGFPIPPQPGPSFASASASGHDNGVGGRVAFQTGLVNQSSPAFAQYIALTASYISRVPFVDYPRFTGGVIVDGNPLNHAAQLSNTDQISYGIVFGADFRF